MKMNSKQSLSAIQLALVLLGLVYHTKVECAFIPSAINGARSAAAVAKSASALDAMATTGEALNGGKSALAAMRGASTTGTLDTIPSTATTVTKLDQNYRTRQQRPRKLTHCRKTVSTGSNLEELPKSASTASTIDDASKAPTVDHAASQADEFDDLGEIDGSSLNFPSQEKLTAPPAGITKTKWKPGLTTIPEDAAVSRFQRTPSIITPASQKFSSMTGPTFAAKAQRFASVAAASTRKFGMIIQQFFSRIFSHETMQKVVTYLKSLKNP